LYADLIAKDHAFNIAAYISSGAVRAWLSSSPDSSESSTFAFRLELDSTTRFGARVLLCCGFVGDAMLICLDK
jgi:hypothetical protein